VAGRPVPRGLPAAATQARKRAAREAHADLLPVIRQPRGEGLSFQGIAARLNEMGHRSNSDWSTLDAVINSPHGHRAEEVIGRVRREELR
jgi:hypothetical protein